MCWGYNEINYLGDGTYSNSFVPVEVPGVATAIQLAVGQGVSCAVTANSKVICWGSDYTILGLVAMLREGAVYMWSDYFGNTYPVDFKGEPMTDDGTRVFGVFGLLLPPPPVTPSPPPPPPPLPPPPTSDAQTIKAYASLAVVCICLMLVY